MGRKKFWLARFELLSLFSYEGKDDNDEEKKIHSITQHNIHILLILP